jgi:hypothetical protein
MPNPTGQGIKDLTSGTNGGAANEPQQSPIVNSRSRMEVFRCSKRRLPLLIDI